MDWKLVMEKERAALQRIVALLSALADLAESASRRSRLVRRFVIWLLRPAETVARDFIIGPVEPLPVSPIGNGPADAMRLAENFRDLACKLECQARLAFAIQEDAGQAGLARLGACRTIDTNDFLNSLRRSVFAHNGRRAACATGPPDTS